VLSEAQLPRITEQYMLCLCVPVAVPRLWQKMPYQLQLSTDLLELRYVNNVLEGDLVKLIVLPRVHNFAHLGEMRVTAKAGRRSIQLLT
jgi:hypothetical protein